MNKNNEKGLIKSHIIVNIEQQTLELFKAVDDEAFDSINKPNLRLQRKFSVSTAKNGIGNLESTGCTPLGKHFIAEKIGSDAPINSVFVGRVATGEIYDETLSKENPERDWILSRILWLKGLEEGVNRGSNELGCCDTYDRYIYIHGTPDSEPMGVPLSHGCIRMRNEDIIWLFDAVTTDTTVDIIAK